MLLGLVEPTEGSATINGFRYRDLREPLRTVGAVLESSGAYPGRTARNHLRVQATIGSVPQSRVDEVLDLVDLTEAGDRRVGRFSLGMRQRLGLATALLYDPEILILDEPANGLDPEGVHWLRALLRGLAAEGRTVLVSSHLLAEVAQTVDSVVILDRGRLISHSRLTDLTAGAEQSVRVRTPRASELAATLSRRGATTQRLEPDLLRIIGVSTSEIGTIAAEHAIPIFEAAAEETDLEQVFLQLTAAAEREDATR
jgi:ABC-2 type transport system ATP-binding protein